MRIVGIPLTVSRAHRRRATPKLIPASLKHDQQVARTTGMIAQQRTTAEDIRHTPRVHLLKVHHKLHMGQPSGIVDQHILHLLNLKAKFLDACMVQEYAIAIDVTDDRQVSSYRLTQIGIKAVIKHIVSHFPCATIHLVVCHPLKVVGSTVISRQKEQVVSLAHMFIESIEQSCEIFVELQIGTVCMLTTRAPGMSDDISLGIADAEHVRHVTFTQLLTLQSGYGHVCSHCATDGVIANLTAQFLRLLVLLQLKVAGLGPFWQLIHIIGTGDKTEILCVQPVGSIGRTACGKDGGTILIRHADDL